MYVVSWNRKKHTVDCILLMQSIVPVVTVCVCVQVHGIQSVRELLERGSTIIKNVGITPHPPHLPHPKIVESLIHH